MEHRSDHARRQGPSGEHSAAPESSELLPALEHQVSLLSYNTFGLEAFAEHFIRVQSEEELQYALKLPIEPKFFLGGGSNLLLTKDLPGLVIKMEISGREVLRRTQSSVWVRAGAGEHWHSFVQWCITQDFGGLENLSLIPGTVGAAPIQNIGAYGVELAQLVLKVETIHLETGKKRVFKASECQFGYRDSFFKRAGKGNYCITHVVFKLSRPPHRLQTAYGDIQRTLSEQNVTAPTIADVSNAVIQIRRSKLPDPSKLGNAGSFFKNPLIPKAQFEVLMQQYPEMPHYAAGTGEVKIPAAWLIERCGWKGKKVGKTGAHAKQALVLVNYGGANGQDIWQLAQDIQTSVYQTFGIRLETEVQVV